MVTHHWLPRVAGSASSSSRKKGRGEIVHIDDTVSKYKEMIQNMRGAIADKKLEIEKLDKEKRELEEYERGS